MLKVLYKTFIETPYLTSLSVNSIILSVITSTSLLNLKLKSGYQTVSELGDRRSRLSRVTTLNRRPS